MKPARTAWSGVPAGVWTLGLVSLFMDLSSELVHALLPLYLAVGLGASTFTIGIIEGVAESIALIMKMFSGVLSDIFRRRKPIAVLGYGLAALTKLIFPLAPSVGWVVTARFADRVGKGIRGAPRDALVADLTPPEVRGASFGLRQALDTVGGLGGPLLALAALGYFAGDFRAAFWVAVVPAVIAVLLLMFGVHEPRVAQERKGARERIRLADIRGLGHAYAAIVAIASVLTLARFSEAFLILRAKDVGLPVEQAPWVMVAMSAVYAVTAFPAGRAADRGHGGRLLGAGLLALVAADLLLAAAGGPVMVHVGAGVWGLHMGLTQGLLAALVAAAAPAHLRGTAFGVFNLATGLALLVASALAGWLWDAIGAAATFYAGAAFTAIAWIGLRWYGTDRAGLHPRGSV